ncbi:MAG: helix-turn-helix transcriptional regulator [Pyrinomonadaceae bacterium]
MDNRVKEERNNKQLTQTQLAELIGVSRQTIFSIETGKYVPSVVLALKLAKEFGETVEEIFRLERSDYDQA